MKIIGHTYHGYICEVSKDEMTLSTGDKEHWDAGRHAHPVGNIVNVPQIAQHVRDMERTVKQRKDAAETLRSVANIIEMVPEAFTAPAPTPPPAPTVPVEAAAVS